MSKALKSINYDPAVDKLVPTFETGMFVIQGAIDVRYAGTLVGYIPASEKAPVCSKQTLKDAIATAYEHLQETDETSQFTQGAEGWTSAPIVKWEPVVGYKASVDVANTPDYTAHLMSKELVPFAAYLTGKELSDLLPLPKKSPAEVEALNEFWGPLPKKSPAEVEALNDLWKSKMASLTCHLPTPAEYDPSNLAMYLGHSAGTIAFNVPACVPSDAVLIQVGDDYRFVVGDCEWDVDGTPVLALDPARD